MRLEKVELDRITISQIELKHISISNDSNIFCRNVSSFNGATSYAESNNRILDLDAVDPSFTFSWWGRFDGNGTHFSQNISSTSAEKEMQLYTFGGFIIYLGGIARQLLSTSEVSDNAGYGVLKVEYNHSLGEIYTSKNGVLLSTQTVIVIGAAREPTARFKYMARSNNSVDSEGFLKEGVMRDVTLEHNGVIVDLPMDESSETTTVNYINRTGNTDYNATGYNIVVTEECSEIPSELNNLTYNDGADNVTFDNGADNVVY